MMGGKVGRPCCSPPEQAWNTRYLPLLVQRSPVEVRLAYNVLYPIPVSNLMSNFPFINSESQPLPGKLADQHVSLGEVIRDTLRARILSGDLKTGDRLVEGKLADELGEIGRASCRERV